MRPSLFNIIGMYMYLPYVIFGGLLVATVLSLFVVPAFYVLMKKLETNWFPASHEQQEPLPQP